MIAALNAEGVRCLTVVDGAVNSDLFEAFVEQVLVPTLRPGDLVAMDNLSSHERARTRELIALSGAELAFLPPYSPDLNPIEPKLGDLIRRSMSDGVEVTRKGSHPEALPRLTWGSSFNESVIDEITVKLLINASAPPRFASRVMHHRA